MGKQGIGGALLRGATGFGEYCGAECKAKAEAAAAGGQTSNQAAAAKNDGIQAVMAVSFEGDAASISNNLSNLLTIFTANKPSGFFGSDDDETKQAKKSIRAAALEKLEMGIMMLRSKGDAAMADFFEKKLAEADPKRAKK
jgi:hypothetical protein